MIQLTCLIPSDLHIDAKMFAVRRKACPCENSWKNLCRWHVQMADNPLEPTNSIRRRTRERS